MSPLAPGPHGGPTLGFTGPRISNSSSVRAELSIPALRCRLEARTEHNTLKAVADAAKEVFNQKSCVSTEARGTPVLRLGAVGPAVLRARRRLQVLVQFRPAHALKHSVATRQDYALADREVVALCCKPGAKPCSCPVCNSDDVTRNVYDKVMLTHGLASQDFIMAERLMCNNCANVRTTEGTPILSSRHTSLKSHHKHHKPGWRIMHLLAPYLLLYQGAGRKSTFMAWDVMDQFGPAERAAARGLLTAQFVLILPVPLLLAQGALARVTVLGVGACVPILEEEDRGLLVSANSALSCIVQR